MAEETLIEVEGSHDRATIASYFRQFADGLESDGSVTFRTDDDEVSVTVPETAEFELEIERETDEEGGDQEEYEIEFEVEWSTDEKEVAEEAILEIGSGTESETEGEQGTIGEAEGGQEPAASDEAAAHSDKGEAGSKEESQHADTDTDEDQ